MTLFTVLCPHCGFTRRVQKEKIPPRAITATCPECGASFPFSVQSSLQHHPETPPPVVVVPALPAGAPPSAAPSAEAVRPRCVTHRFVFTGRAGEYFGIWIINLLLKVVTLGLYSAWAKVRKRRYFYGNTLLDQTPFDYIADPWAIFRGWCLGVLLFIVYSIGSRVSPTLGMVFGVAIFLAIPWVIVRSRIFSARNSTHRNIRFTFRPNYREGYVVYAGLPLLIPFSLGFIAPYMIYRQQKFHVENSGFGQTPFTFTARAGDFYRLFLRIGLGFLLIFLLLGVVAALVLGPMGGFTPEPAHLFALAPLAVLAFAAFYFFFAIYVQTRLTNLTWNSTRLGDAQFASSLRMRDMAWLYLSSAVAIFCTFGLMIPWVAVRLARYRAEHMAMSMVGELRTLAADQAEVGAAGEELGDIFGIEVGLGVG
jgi:uncharacterized membrane protein YjgN (DUF898 family)